MATYLVDTSAWSHALRKHAPPALKANFTSLLVADEIATCDVVKNLGPYVIVTSNYTPATCTTGVISSATVTQIDQATASLKSAKVFPPFPIQVLNK